MRHRNRGFTLIELMVVVSIIGILSSIAIPGFQRMLLHSRRAELPLNLNAISMAEVSYHAEWGFYTSCATSPPNIPGKTRTMFPANVTSAMDWNELGWNPDGRVYGQYRVVATGGSQSNATFVADGFTDLDVDGNYAHYTADPLLQPWVVTATNIY
jgi:prepilin-type N-terminal cleavage/methylation domain-containing protein